MNDTEAFLAFIVLPVAIFLIMCGVAIAQTRRDGKKREESLRESRERWEEILKREKP